MLLENVFKELQLSNKYAGVPERSKGQGLGPCDLVSSAVRIRSPAIFSFSKKKLSKRKLPWVFFKNPTKETFGKKKKGELWFQEKERLLNLEVLR